MTNVIIDKWNQMYKLISQHKFTINGNVNDDYKCVICKNILINAHQAICGCNYCYECINQYMVNGAINCPNNTEECKLESLSNIAPNHKMNKLISNLIVRCSNKMCSHECKLKEMENHLNLCLIKAVKCPFINVGCEPDDMINNELNDHMLSDIHNHNKILIDLIGNLRNEMRELKEKVEGNRLEIEILKENDRRKNEIIESLKEEIQSIKQKNEDLTEQMEIGDRNLWYKFDEIDIEMKNQYKKEELLKEFDEIFDMKTKKMREENEKIDIERLNKIDKIDKYLKMRDYGLLFWQIGKINQIKLMTSESFYDKQNPYKMCFQLENINDELNIRMRLCRGEFDADLKWPCQSDIIIHIYALNDWNINKTVTKSCEIAKPTHYLFKWSDPIKIAHSDLIESNLTNRNCLFFCIVKFR